MPAYDEIIIKSKTSSASFSPHHGGMMTSLIMQAPEGLRELLYFAPEYQFNNHQGMNGGAPFCFPICGRLLNSQYQHQGKTYHMNIHGFAYQMPWQVLNHDGHSISLCLRDNDISLEQYPFHFEIVLTYEIKDNELICKQSYKNTGTEPMPYYAGFHPYLKLPFSKAETFLAYEPQKRLQYNNDLTDIIGEAQLFTTPTNLLLPELNESLVMMSTNKKIYLTFPDHTQLEIEAQGVEDSYLFAYTQLYHRIAEPFLCIELWMSFPNSMNHKNAVCVLAPGATEHGIFVLKLKSDNQK